MPYYSLVLWNRSQIVVVQRNHHLVDCDEGDLEFFVGVSVVVVVVVGHRIGVVVVDGSDYADGDYYDADDGDDDGGGDDDDLFVMASY